jgi:AraC-like DNA-binding protein
MDLLKKTGVEFESEKQTIMEIAKLNKMSPQRVYLSMKSEEKPGTIKALPDTPQRGFGKHSLADICQEYNLNISTILRGFADNNIKATADATIKQIAEQNNISSSEVYEIIKNTAK